MDLYPITAMRSDYSCVDDRARYIIRVCTHMHVRIWGLRESNNSRHLSSIKKTYGEMSRNVDIIWSLIILN